MRSTEGQRLKKNKGMLEKDVVYHYDDAGNVISETYKYRNTDFSIFEDDLFAELYNARCHDTGEQADAEGARNFREEILKRNDQNSEVINIQSMRLGINSIISLANSLIDRKFTKLNLADNAISDYGMHAIKNILECSNIEQLNLASNMISGEGLENLVEALSNHPTLAILNLGLHEGSMRKNSLGLQGATCLAAILLKNTALETLVLEDNDIGSNGGECFGIALTQNTGLKHLKISENELKTEGAIFIIKNSAKLESLDLSKNYITAQAGPALEKLVSSSRRIKKLVIEYNELLPAGAEFISRGILKNNTLVTLDLKGNILGDDGVFHIVNALQGNTILRDLNLALNEIGPMGATAIAHLLPQTKIKSLNISKNYLGDEAIIVLANTLSGAEGDCKLQSLNLASCRIGDRGVEVFFSSIIDNKALNQLNFSDNYISEKLEAHILECLENNFFLCKVFLGGNRLSHACITKVKKMCERNRREKESAEPNRLKNEQYRLEYEKKKLHQAEEKLNQQVLEVDKVKEHREDIMNQIEALKENERNKRELERQKIQEEQNMIQEKENKIAKAKSDLEELQRKYDRTIEDMKIEYEEKLKRKEQIEQEIRNLEEENKDLETDIPEMIKELQDKIQETRKNTALVEEETRQVREEIQRLEQELKNVKPDTAADVQPAKKAGKKKKGGK